MRILLFALCMIMTVPTVQAQSNIAADFIGDIWSAARQARLQKKEAKRQKKQYQETRQRIAEIPLHLDVLLSEALCSSNESAKKAAAKKLYDEAYALQQEFNMLSTQLKPVFDYYMGMAWAMIEDDITQGRAIDYFNSLTADFDRRGLATDSMLIYPYTYLGAYYFSQSDFKAATENFQKVVRIVGETDATAVNNLRAAEQAYAPVAAEQARMSRFSNLSEVTIDTQNDMRFLTYGKGDSYNAAIDHALINALKMLWPKFVSADTSLLSNADAVKEMLSPTSGCITGFSRVADLRQNDTDHTIITIDVVVSLPGLWTFVKNKGAKAELSTANFGLKARKDEFYVQQEMSVLNNLLSQVEKLMPYAYDRELETGEPETTSIDKIVETTGCTSYLHNTSGGFESGLINTAANMCFDFYYYSRDARESQTKTALLSWLKSASNAYQVALTVRYKPNETSKSLLTFLINTLESLSLSRSAYELKQKGIEATDYLLVTSHGKDGHDVYYRFTLRNNKLAIDAWNKKLSSSFFKRFFGFQVKDNTGQVSYFTGYNEKVLALSWYASQGRKDSWKENGKWVEREYRQHDFTDFVWTRQIDHPEGWLQTLKGHGLLSPFFILEDHTMYFSYIWFPKSETSHSREDVKFDLFSDTPTVKLHFLIPKADLPKYSSFTLENRTLAPVR